MNPSHPYSINIEVNKRDKYEQDIVIEIMELADNFSSNGTLTISEIRTFPTPYVYLKQIYVLPFSFP